MAVTKTAIEPIDAAGLPNVPGRAMSQAVRYGDVVVLAGIMAFDDSGKLVEGGAREQADQCFRTIERLLGQAGATMEDLVEVICFLGDIKDVGAYMDARGAAFSSKRPPATTTIISNLAYPGSLLEVKATAAIGPWRE
jgi:enamine deaminase RidA (YjgF/YER057c/UK114 family)